MYMRPHGKAYAEVKRLQPSTSPANSLQGQALPARLKASLVKEDVPHRQRRGRAQREAGFDAGGDTQLRYFEDPVCCDKSSPHFHTRMSIDKLNDGQYTPVAVGETQADSHYTIRKWVNDLTQQHSSWTASHRRAQQTPFSSLPIIQYSPMSALHPQIRVALPQPFAYTLQLYESIDQPDSSCEHEQRSGTSASESKPPSSNVAPASLASFTQYLPKDSLPSTPRRRCESISSHVIVDSISTPTSNSMYDQPLRTKTYMLVCQYTRKGKNKASETTILAPAGSSFEFAMDMFRKVFRKKTGLNWDEVKIGHGFQGTNSGVPTNGSRDSSIGLNGIKFRETDTILSEKLSRHDSENVSIASGTIQGDEPVNIATKLAIDPAEAVRPTNADAVTPLLDKVTSSENNDLPTSISPWTLSSSKDVGRAGYRPFVYVPTDRKTFKEGNEKYKARYSEDLFLFPKDQPATVAKTDSDVTGQRSDSFHLTQPEG